MNATPLAHVHAADVPTQIPVYAPPVSRPMLGWFSLSAAVMLVHKAECWITTEWLVSPAYQYATTLFHSYSHDTINNTGQTAFSVFVFCLGVSVLAISMILSGRRGTWLFLALWGCMFGVEWHHIVRSVSAGEYYSGVYSAMAFVAIGPLYWRQLIAEVRGHAASA